MRAGSVTPFERGRGGPGGWRFIADPELHLGKDILVPDVAGWKGRTDASWTLVANHFGEEKIRLEPFAEVELDLLALWVPQPAATPQ